MLLASLTRWLRPVLTVFALAGTLALGACGGGSGAINNPSQPSPTPTPTLSTLPAGVIIAYAQVPTTVKIVGGVGPYQALSSNSAVLPVPLNVSGDTLVLIANPVAPGSDVPVSITISDQSGQTTVVNVTVRFAPLFQSGLIVTPSGSNCGVNVCDGETASVRTVATGVGGAPLPGRQVRFDVVYGPYAILTSNPGSPVTSTLTVVTDAAGVAEIQIQATPNATTQQAQIRATDVATGQSQTANFIVQRTTNATNLSVVPPSAAIQTLYNNACSTGFVIDYYIYGGTPPYTVASTFPNAVILAPSVVTQSGGFFRAITNGQCVNPLTFTIVDSAGKVVTATLTNIPGTQAPPSGGPPAAPALVLAPSGGYTRPATFCQGGNTLTFTANGGTPPYNALIIPTGATPSNPLPTLPNGNVIAAANAPIDVAFPSPTLPGSTYSLTIGDSSTPQQIVSQPISCN